VTPGLKNVMDNESERKRESERKERDHRLGRVVEAVTPKSFASMDQKLFQASTWPESVSQERFAFL